MSTTVSEPRRQGLRGVSLRLRLALLSTILVGATLLVFGLGVFFLLQRTLRAEVDRSLADRARVVNDTLSVTVSPLGRVTVDLSGVDAFSGTAVQAVVPGRPPVRSDNLGSYSLPVSDTAYQEALRGHETWQDVKVADTYLRMYNGPLNVNNHAIGMLQVARDRGPTEAALAVLRLVLVAGGLGSVAICTLLGLLVSRAALRPIDQLTREAERIGEAGDFSLRVSGRTATRSDEVGRLAATFNAMLDRLQEAFGALQRANERLEAALTSQRRFVADASHELRTPLTTVRGNASLLRRFDRLTPEDRAAAVAQIAAESERMSRLVNDLLTLARADAGQLLERRPVTLGPLIDDVALQGRVLADGKVPVSVVRLADAEVMGDADALRQLLLILVDNAIKYTPPGGSVTLGLSTDAPGTRGREGTARVTVVDTGVGIPAADVPHVFERFYRADRARRAGGTGLGLAIGKWIAQAHGGDIAVESAPGTGSIFTVTLPAISVTPLPPPPVRRQEAPKAVASGQFPVASPPGPAHAAPD